MSDDRDYDIRSFYDRKFIQAFDLCGKDVTITIAGVRKEKIRGKGGETSRAILRIEGRDMEFIPCGTDAKKVIAGMYGKDTRKWKGQRITLFATTCMSFGEMTECIRVRPTPPVEDRSRKETAGAPS